MSTVEINRIEDVRKGDVVTMARNGVTVTGPTGDYIGSPAVFIEGVGNLYAYQGWAFVSATREVPEHEPDDIEALRRSLEAAREGYRKEAADRRARDQRLGAEIDRLEAEAEQLRLEVAKYREEAERWKAEAEMLTAKVDRLMPLQEHENECAYRQRAEKAEAEVERLRAARQVPTRKQIVDAMWPDAPESARAGMTHLDTVDRVVDLFEQDGAA